MTIKLHDLVPAPGSKKKPKRIARGTGGKGGKTAGRGTKGQHARRQVKPGLEGGQTPLHRRTPKLRGFNNPFRVEYLVINLDAVQGLIDGGITDITPETLREAGLVHKHGLVKVLGRGELTGAASVKAHAFSASASAAITAAGGSVEVLPAPFGVRPASSGNQFTNR
jgi:large subunit ribosomal protein L15